MLLEKEMQKEEEVVKDVENKDEEEKPAWIRKLEQLGKQLEEEMETEQADPRVVEQLHHAYRLHFVFAHYSN